jgi:ATP/maltotriose-dependent transcriptional regulator MalT
MGNRHTLQAATRQAPGSKKQQQQAQAEAQQLEAQAHALTERGEHAAAVQLQRRAVGVLQTGLGASHAASVSALARLASCCGRLGDAAAAESLFRQVSRWLVWLWMHAEGI